MTDNPAVTETTGKSLQGAGSVVVASPVHDSASGKKANGDNDDDASGALSTTTDVNPTLTTSIGSVQRTIVAVEDVGLSGWFLKRGEGKHAGFKKRFFRLEGNVIGYYVRCVLLLFLLVLH